MNAQLKKAAPIILIAILAVFLLIVRQCKHEPTTRSPATVTNKAAKKDEGTVNRDNGFDRRISYLEYSNHAKCRMQCRRISQAEVEEMGVVYDLIIMNPTEYFQLATIYGASLNDLLSSLGFDIFVTNRVAAGSAYVVAQGQVGEMRIEAPLETETWYEEKTQRFWTQTSVRPLWFVDNSFAVLKLTGLT